MLKISLECFATSELINSPTLIILSQTIGTLASITCGLVPSTIEIFSFTKFNPSRLLGSLEQ